MSAVLTSATDSDVIAVQVFNGIIDVLEPIHHGGDEKTGSTPVLRSITSWDDEAGEMVRVPFISGNAIRGMLRRIAFADLLNSVGYECTSKKLHHGLYSGGTFEKTADDDDGSDIKFREWLRDLFPQIALFGLSLCGQSVSSCMDVGHGQLICRENRWKLTPAGQSDRRSGHRVREFTDISFATRRDDLREKREEGEQATQMKIEFECIIAGARMEHRFSLQQATPLESSCLAHIIELWQRDPHIGAKSASGYGRVRPVYQDLPSAEIYRNYVNDNRNEINAGFVELAAKCERVARAAKGSKSKKSSDDGDE